MPCSSSGPIKFPDLIHAVKPEPNNEIPQAASAHDTFWDFISLTPESAHIADVGDERPRPAAEPGDDGRLWRSHLPPRECKGKSRFVKFTGSRSKAFIRLFWDEAQKLSGKDADFHRRDLFEAIERATFLNGSSAYRLLKKKTSSSSISICLTRPIIPEELVPVRRVGKMTLTRNTDNYFAETEQVAFHTGHIVPASTSPTIRCCKAAVLVPRYPAPARWSELRRTAINRPLSPVTTSARCDGAHRHQQGTRLLFFPTGSAADAPCILRRPQVLSSVMREG